MEKLIQCQLHEQVAVLTIDRPKALNALNNEVLHQLGEALEQLEQDKAVRVIIITGAGSKAFVAGADIATMQPMTPEQGKAFSVYGQSVMDRITKMSAIVIAAVNGFALGGGCELAMACDFRIAATNAKFAIPEVSLGVIPGFGGTQRLPRLVGVGRAMELMATGGQINAEEAYRMGLVNHVLSQEELMDYCLSLAQKIAANSFAAVALGKQSIHAATELDLSRGLAYESSQFGLTFANPDQREGMNAFLEKRKANFA